jgi:hypothetical protein
MTFNWYDILGTLGVAIIILTYVMLQIERVRSDQLSYSLLNAVGASLILLSLYFNFNLPAFFVEFFWLLISLFGIGKYLLRRRAWIGSGAQASCLRSATTLRAPVALVQCPRAYRAAASSTRVSEIITFTAYLIASVLAVYRPAWPGRKERPTALKNSRPGQCTGEIIRSGKKNVVPRKWCLARRPLCKAEVADIAGARGGRLHGDRNQNGEKNRGYKTLSLHVFPPMDLWKLSGT